MAANRAVGMAFMQGYIELLVFYDDNAKLHVMDGKDIKEVPIKVAKFIFEQKKRQ